MNRREIRPDPVKKGPWYLDLIMSGADWQPTETQPTELAKLAAARL